jgi:hypothetical protein
MGYPTESEESFFSRFCRRVRTVGTVAHEFSLCKGMIVHGASLSQLLIFCNKLPSKPPLAASTKKQPALGRPLGLCLARQQSLASRASAAERIVRIPGIAQRLEPHRPRIDHQQPSD